MAKAWALLVFIGVMTGCTASVKEQSVVINQEKTELDGIWVGSFDIRGRGPYDFYAIHVGERSTAVSNKAKAMCVGQVHQDGEYYYAKYNLYALDGSPFDYARLTGEIKEGQIESHFTTLNGGDTGRMQLAYNDVYEQPSALELLEGKWRFTDRDGLVLDVSIENGVMQGVDSDECKYTGNVSLINAKYNAYDVVFQISHCDSVNGEYEGLGYIDNSGLGDDQENTGSIYFRVDVGNERYGFHYDLEKQ